MQQDRSLLIEATAADERSNFTKLLQTRLAPMKAER